MMNVATIVSLSLCCFKIIQKTLFYPIHILRAKYYQWSFRNKHKNFYSDSKTRDKNLLMLCHSRAHGVPILRDTFKIKDFSDYDITTVDINPDFDPHIICDIASDDLNCEKFDIVALFNCNCHTEAINQDINILAKIKKLLKDDGLVMIKNSSIIDSSMYCKDIILMYFRVAAEYMSYFSYLKETNLLTEPYLTSGDRVLSVYSFNK